MGVGGAAAYKGGKAVLGKMSDMFGLKSSAIALDGSAAALTRAAVALGGSAVADGDLVGRKGPGASASWLMMLGSWAALLSPLLTSGDDPLNSYMNASPEQRQKMRDEANARSSRKNAAHNTSDNSGGSWRRFFLGDAADPNFNFMDHMRMDPGGANTPAASSAPVSAIDRMLAGMDKVNDTTVSPKIDTGAIDTAIGKAQTLLNILKQAGSAFANAGAGSSANAGQQMRRNLADYGVAP